MGAAVAVETMSVSGETASEDEMLIFSAISIASSTLASREPKTSSPVEWACPTLQD